MVSCSLPQACTLLITFTLQADTSRHLETQQRESMGKQGCKGERCSCNQRKAFKFHLFSVLHFVLSSERCSSCPTLLEYDSITADQSSNPRQKSCAPSTCLSRGIKTSGVLNHWKPFAIAITLVVVLVYPLSRENHAAARVERLRHARSWWCGCQRRRRGSPCTSHKRR